jgi:GAF domain-containing protein
MESRKRLAIESIISAFRGTTAVKSTLASWFRRPWLALKAMSPLKRWTKSGSPAGELAAARSEVANSRVRIERYRTAIRLAGIELDRRNRGIRALTAFTYQASRLSEPAALMKLALSQALLMTEAQMGAIILIDAESKNLSLGAHRGLTADMVRILTGRQYDTGAATLMPHLVMGKGALLEDTDTIDPAERMLLNAAQVNSLVSLPLQAEEQLLGALIIGTHGQERLSGADLYFLIALGQEAAIALECLHLRDKLWHIAETLLTREAETNVQGMRDLDFNPTLPALPPLQAKLANVVADVGGTMGAIFAINRSEKETQVTLVADYGLSPVFTGTFACFLLSDGLLPDDIVDTEIIITDIDHDLRSNSRFMLTSLYNEGARSLLTMRLNETGSAIRFLLIAATEPHTLTQGVNEQLRTAAQGLLPLMVEPPSVPTFPTRSVHVPSMSRMASDDDLEKLLAAMMEAEEESFRHNSDLITLNNISALLARTFNLSQVWSQVISEARPMLNVEAAWLYLNDPLSPERLVLRACEGLSERYQLGMQRIFIGDGMEGQVARQNQAVYLNDTQQHRQRCEILIDQEGIMALASVPLTYEVEQDGREEQLIVGVLSVGMRSTYTWQAREIRLLTAIANQIALATHNAALYNQVQDTLDRLAASNQLLQELNKQLLTSQMARPPKKGAA